MANLGTDLGDFGPVETELTGRELLVHDLCWRFRTDEASLWTDRGYGYNLLQFANDSVGEERLPAIENRAALECKKDDRVSAASVKATLEQVDALRQRLRLRVNVTDAAGPFQFVVAVTSDAFDLEVLWP